MNSYLEAHARERLDAVLDPGSFREFLPPSLRIVSPHLGQLDAPVSFDDGVAIGAGKLFGEPILVAAQEGGFMGGAVGEVHGAKLTGLLQRALRERPYAVLLLLESGGVRLHEANAGLIAVSEVMRALLEVRAAGIPVIVLVGGSNGCFGGMGIVACCANAIVMSEEGRLAMSGPEVIETANGVEEFDARDRALVWRTTGGKHRYLLGDCQMLVADDSAAFRQAAFELMQECHAAAATISLTLEALEAEQQFLQDRVDDFGAAVDPLDIWQKIGLADAANLPMLEADAFVAATAQLRRRP
ncbi:biotin-independent malonate decarboxylase subunit beta [Collimonas pratensis]|uniref:Malonate decarboxylase, beta subunit n=1 Tax=Collimonas pratensis TaxID=279113 RepID=A0A127Q3H5_9BURK|nr:biotin-independent malonate decarboxylase subunit beta [Collimonas pratensis]AMP04567.1 malonate decarboxylase, beta subunit [Collimonas pratensis]AMP15375.1 malonate decarboxylase, beta subunit [Collimonas pratensis]NKI69768.1 biotin-independent malonate decarboxylase subunit beta [Collimonas pratensis]